MGTNTAGDQSDVKIHFRDPKVWYEREEPVQNDKKYREGDNVFDILTGTLYYNYIEGFVPALDGDDNPLPVTIDDIFEGSTKLNALRSTTTVFAETTNVDFEPPTVNGHSSWGGGTLIRGDIIEVSLTGSATDKRWNWTVASVVDDLDLNGDPIGTQTLTWENKRSYYGSRSFTVTDFNINPLTNADFKTLYVTGDFVVDANQRKYEFDEDTFTLTFVGFDREPTVFTETKNSMWTPTVTNGFVLNWNSQPDTTFMVGDVLRVQAEGSTTNKVFEYLVTGQQPVVLSARTNPNPTRVHTYNGGVSGSPPRNDADYSAGDFIDNLTDGYRYGGYVENQLTDATSWPQFIKVSSSGIIITDDANPDVTYKLGMSNFNPYFEVLTVTVPDPTE
ncbi:hypothetical protein [Vibrio phage RYC]|nr:hypothetical protein [Vibrio phage RYC]